MMAILWRYFDDVGQAIGASEPFVDQESAEAWLTESWRDLYEQGIDEVALVEEGGELVYRMGLHEGIGG